MSTSAEFPPEVIQAYVLGTLDGEEVARIKAATAQDSELAAELAIWEAARDVQAEDATRSDPGAFGWARIERAIDARSRSASANDNGSAAPRPLWIRNVIKPWQAAAAVAAGVLGWQVAVVPTITGSTDGQQPAYELASGEDTAEFAVRIAFTEATTESDLRALLREAEGRIVDGPSAIGLYTVAFDDAAAKQRAIGLLEGRTDIVAEVAE